MNTPQRRLIANEVERRVVKTSQRQIATQCGVSNATISQILNNNWDSISDEMWRKVEVTLRMDFNWHTAPTTNFKLIYDLVKTAKSQSLSIGISDTAGKGKTEAFTKFAREHSNVIYIECKNYWTKKSYIKQLLINSGLTSLGSTETLINAFLRHLKGLYKPVVIIDQFDKLKNPQLDLFMDFYNDLHGHCAFVISGVEALEKRIERGVSRDTVGYAELYSRIGRKFIKLDPITLADVKAICNANGIKHEEDIEDIYNNCENDLRRVRRDIDKLKLKANHQQISA